MNNTLNSSTILNITIEKIDGAYAPSTIRAYKANFERFIQFCESLNIDALPASSSNVAQYIAQLTKSGLKSSSIRIAVASISSIHKLNLLSDPTQHPDVKIEMRRMHRTLGRASNQAFGITAPILEKMLGVTANNLRGYRDRALLLLAYDSLCRRSELVSLRITDIQVNKVDDQSQMKIRLRKSKTDQELQGKWIFLTKRSSDAITLWLDQANLIDGFLFRGINNAIDITPELKSNQINRIYKRLAKDTKLPKEIVDHISGHSMRVGAAQDLLVNGASLSQIMRWVAGLKWIQP
ncbi:tyrosine-type recombinase/integrase [Polynucleobacter paneuropaeus]|uniref:tyrosine-type recombinase/integrase n=1 Tax=Polynucleobacter paneuropaeus TaxID=2527775 RepID=UPI001BFE522D|nr:tyrosine-type recombinase/integrase [Polynucleobacter paneuropaeus]MBT8621922.1 tyrosine-type recombinase/integrase [Polynucleobacter paneuropaeus]